MESPKVAANPAAFLRFEGMVDKQIAFSTMVIKAVDEGKREFTGIASTPTPDRVNDVMVPKGAKFNLPIPFLWQHNHLQPIGEITEARVTAKGIEVKGVVKQVSAPSQLAARLEEAWVSMKEGLVRGLSIGFRPIKYAFLDNGGVEYEEWDWYELSAVTVAANQEASIARIKSLDAQFRASKGSKTEAGAKKPSGFAEKPSPKVKLSKPNEDKMSIADKLKGFKSEYSAKAKKLEEMMEKSLDGGETFDEAQQEEYDTLESEVKALEGHIEKAERLLTAKAKTAKVVSEDDGQDETKAAAARNPHITVRAEPKLEKGIEFARYAMCHVASKGNLNQALSIAKNHYGQDSSIAKALEFQSGHGGFEGVMKAAVAAGTTLQSTWAAPLVDYMRFTGDFIEYLRPRTIIGQFGAGGVPSLRRIPFNVRIPSQTSGGAAYWVGEGAPKPLTKFDFDDVELRWAKIASIAVLTEELIRFSDPAAEALVRDSLAQAVVATADTDFIDPSNNGASNVKPASILNGASTAASGGGTDAEAVRCDVQTLWSYFIAANNPPQNAVYIMNSTVALALSLMQNPLGQSEFPGLTLRGGTFMGVPVIVSDYVPAGVVALVNASDIYFSDDGQVTIDASREASLQMLDNSVSGAGAPTNNSATATATSLVSMFQTNSVALRAERYINWARRRTSAVAYLTGVNWGICGS